ncbi:MAG: hypothetical protein HYY92_03910 [Parcubacteria group bacterium]|nr:hypothetical protein [Parcubacteria group bacterium]
MRIFTHESPDLDALMSVVAARRYYRGASEAEITLKPANWDGNGMSDGDLALDMYAGGRGMKGEKGEGVVHSCFALIMMKYAPTADCLALAPVIAYVDAQDTHGNAVKHLVPEASQAARDILDATGLSARVLWLKTVHKDSLKSVVERLEEDFLGMLVVGRSRILAEEEASRAELFADGAVALAVDMKSNAVAHLYKRGVRIVVFKNSFGTGVTREQNEALRMDHPKFLAVIQAAGGNAQSAGEDAIPRGPVRPRSRRGGTPRRT